MNNTSLHIGDQIIDSEQIHIVLKIEDDKIFYQPLISNNTNGSCSIPIKNLSLACIRPILTKLEVKNFLDNLLYEEPITFPSNTTNNQINNSNSLKDILYLNNPSRTGRLLVFLHKIEKESKLSRADQTTYDQALSHLADEISVVTKISFESAKEKILKTLDKR